MPKIHWAQLLRVSEGLLRSSIPKMAVLLTTVYIAGVWSLDLQYDN